MSEVVLRDANADDAAVMTDLIHAAFAEYKGQYDPPIRALDETVENVTAKLAEGGGTLALVDGVNAGCVLYYPQDDVLYLGRLAVLPQYRRNGIGLALVVAVETKALEQKWERVQTVVRTALSWNLTFFEKLGYRVIAHKTLPGQTEPIVATLEKVVQTPS